MTREGKYVKYVSRMMTSAVGVVFVGREEKKKKKTTSKMADAMGSKPAETHVGKEKRKSATKRYWQNTELNDPVKTEDRNHEKDSENHETSENKTERKKKRKHGPQGKKFISGKKDPFPGPAPVPEEKIRKFQRGQTSIVANDMFSDGSEILKSTLKDAEETSKLATEKAARFDLLLSEDAGFLEADEGEETCTIAQDDIADAVDITSGTKYFNLSLTQFGPYRLDYTRNGRHLLLGGRRGHVSCFDWHSKQLMCEINVMETVNDVKWLHSEAMFAVAQKKWLYIYDNTGIELHCIRRFNDVLRMQFLPYHFLLATASATGFLQYLDVSVGKQVAATCTKAGRLDVMAQNPYNAIIHLGHPTGVVTLWSPNQREPLVKMLCHRGGVRSIAVDKTGTYMVTSGLDRKLKVFDIRAFRPLQSYFLPAGASCLSLSQRGLLSACTGDIVQVYKDVWGTPVKKPYMAHRVRGAVWGAQFCPFEDVLGIGHGEGFTSMIVPGAGEPNFDGLDSNPYRSVKQRQEWEVKALLEKIQPELISLDPDQLCKVDRATWEQRHQERVKQLGYDPLAKEKFTPRHKGKGRSSSGNIEKRKRQVAHEDQRELIRQTVEEKLAKEKEIKEKEKKKAQQGQRSALDRFKK
ncbi:WD repeat-containing protein 46 isoform X1 [Scleropages formosus]|uniref:WD repeat-containing protein 46 n=2 Tax=Scleropages formosus TaxID=113540 RepID=A0A8C9RYP7_SCLFO|nr:WD repeat-containing protein 46 isoform X1 [Scleropages formosus]